MTKTHKHAMTGASGAPGGLETAKESVFSKGFQGKEALKFTQQLNQPILNPHDPNSVFKLSQ